MKGIILAGRSVTDLYPLRIMNKDRATIFRYYVEDPQRFGVVEFNEWVELDIEYNRKRSF